MEVLGIALGTLAILALISLLLSALFLWLGAKMAGVKSEKSTFGNSFLAALGVAVVTWLVAWLGSLLNISGAIGFIIGLILTILVIKGIFEVAFGRAILVWFFNLIAQALAILVGFLIFGSTVLAIFH